MATKRLLVDAIHPEETRIVVTSGNRLEEFDFESATRRQLRGNIYLAKVTRVEPSLQAAFVEYGGNRHGFLAFSEIHPDYYQIPVADREALLRAEEEEEAEELKEAEAAEEAEEAARERIAEERASADAAAPESVSEPTGGAGDPDAGGAETATSTQAAGPREAAEENPQSTGPASEIPAWEPGGVSAYATEDSLATGASDDGEEDARGHIEEAPAETEPVESVGTGDALEEIRERRRPRVSRRNYKIQEVIKRRQVMLVQVVKEERGNKGAALTTYLSLAGRYSVLMPNTARGGGISRKITNAADRKRLKEIVGDLDIPPGQGIILRTAGASRTRAEVKRDFEYLQRLWENVRTLTLKSTAPCLVYEEGSLIKRTIRDLYSKDIDEVWVAGEDAYREAKDFMRMIMPSHAKNVQLYKEDQPVFSRYGVESQLDQMFSPQVNLPSGGYIVINPTEALVSIDVNSGRATKEHNIEDTALQTNLEAAEEVARQLRLRDLAGLIVIDFIDMIENRSNRAVERRLKDSLKNDRARIQVGRISHFGLMEMSRQRIRFGVIESSTHKCPVCQGTGIVRSTESVALMVMRAVEDHVLRKPGNSINVRMPTDVALYVLNGKRHTLNQLEGKYQLSITVVADDHIPGAHYLIERGEPRLIAGEAAAPSHVRVDTAAMEEPAEEDEEAAADEGRAAGEEAGRPGRGGRRRRGRGRDRELEPRTAAEHAEEPPVGETEDAEADADAQERGASPPAEGDETRRGRRRRGRRGGRRNRRTETGDVPPMTHGDADAGTTEEEARSLAPESVTPPEAGMPEMLADSPGEQLAQAAPGPDRPRRPRRRRVERDARAPGETQTEAPRAEAVAPAAPISGPEERSTKAESEPAESPEPPQRPRKELPPDEIVVSSSSPSPDAEKPKKGGWWQRGFFGS